MIAIVFSINALFIKKTGACCRYSRDISKTDTLGAARTKWPVEDRGFLPYMGYVGMCCCEGYGFEAVYSGIRNRMFNGKTVRD